MAIKQYCGRRQNEIIDMKKKQKKGTLNGIEELEDAKKDGMKYCETCRVTEGHREREGYG